MNDHTTAPAKRCTYINAYGEPCPMMEIEHHMTSWARAYPSHSPRMVDRDKRECECERSKAMNRKEQEILTLRDRHIADALRRLARSNLDLRAEIEQLRAQLATCAANYRQNVGRVGFLRCDGAHKWE